jgi:hypothetical protein
MDGRQPFMSRDRVLFERKVQKIGGVWALIATHPSGQQEDVIGFHTVEEAEEWRKSNGCRALRTRGYLSQTRENRIDDPRLDWLINADFFDHASYRLPISEVCRVRSIE